VRGHVVAFLEAIAGVERHAVCERVARGELGQGVVAAARAGCLALNDGNGSVVVKRSLRSFASLSEAMAPSF